MNLFSSTFLITPQHFHVLYCLINRKYLVSYILRWENSLQKIIDICDSKYFSDLHSNKLAETSSDERLL